MFEQLSGKMLELLKEAVPRASKIAILHVSANPFRFARKEIQDTAYALRVQLQPLELRGPDDFATVFAAMKRERAGALLVLPDPLIYFHQTRIVGLAAQNRLPAMYPAREFVDGGGLMSYGQDRANMWHRAAVFVDKILKGAKPADLPVEQPTTFELAVNLKTAKALGLTIPPSVLVRADQVIQ